MDAQPEFIWKVHVQENGWRFVGYHYMITADGKIHRGRQDEVQGAHAYGYNHDSIGICLMGGLKEGTREPEDNFTVEQKRSLSGLLMHLQSKYGDQVEIVGHNDLDRNKDCPCFDLHSFLEDYHVLRSRMPTWEFLHSQGKLDQVSRDASAEWFNNIENG